MGWDANYEGDTVHRDELTEPRSRGGAEQSKLRSAAPIFVASFASSLLLFCLLFVIIYAIYVAKLQVASCNYARF